MKQLNIFLSFLLVGSAVLIGLYSIATLSSNALILSAILFWLNNINYSCGKFKERSYFFFFNLTFFVFLLGRPMINVIRGENIEEILYWHYSENFNLWLSMELITLSLIFLWIGAVLGNFFINKRLPITYTPPTYKESFYSYNLKWISLTLFLIAFIAEIMLGMEKIIFILANSYTTYYTLFKSRLPYSIYIISTFLQPSLCLFLITYPPKKQTYSVLFLYVLSTILDLIGGERNPFVLAILFCLIYFIYRDYLGDEVKWISKFEKRMLLLGTPIGLFCLSMINYIRDGATSDINNFIDAIIDLIYKQGVTFSWLCSGVGVLKKLPRYGNANYTFGGIIDYFKYGSIGQKFFGIESLGNGNSLRHALNGNSMAHQLSYVLLEKKYLDGHGCGSSYLLEVYADYGILGICIFSFILGMLLITAFTFAKRSISSGTIMLLTITGTLFMPRSTAIGGFNFILRMPFWITFFTCMIVSNLFTHKYRKLCG